MAEITIDGVLLSPLKIIQGPLGDVLHAVKRDDEGFVEFGEAYFSTISQSSVKGWRLHRRMVLNITVPLGSIKFVFFDSRQSSITCGITQEVVLSRSNYQRLTVPNNIWMAFQGLEENNLLLNVASMKHNPEEEETLPLQNELIHYSKW